MKLEIKNLTFSYNKTSNVLDDISFSVNSSDIVAIMGVNGAGKSTLLKCLGGILKHGSGDILIDDKSVNEISINEKAKIVSYVPQDANIDDGMVFDFILTGRKPYIRFQISNDDLKMVGDILKILDIEKLAFNNINDLSGGEKQKVLIARSLVQEANILLFDEPTSNLDLKNQLETVNLIKEIVSKENLSAIVTMHDLNLALRLANKFIFMKDGKIYKMGEIEIVTKETIKEVYNQDVEVIDIDKQKVVVIK